MQVNNSNKKNMTWCDLAIQWNTTPPISFLFITHRTDTWCCSKNTHKERTNYHITRSPITSCRKVIPKRLHRPAPLIGVGKFRMYPLLLYFYAMLFNCYYYYLPPLFLTCPWNLRAITLSLNAVPLSTHDSHK